MCGHVSKTDNCSIGKKDIQQLAQPWKLNDGNFVSRRLYFTIWFIFSALRRKSALLQLLSNPSVIVFSSAPRTPRAARDMGLSLGYQASSLISWIDLRYLENLIRGCQDYGVSKNTSFDILRTRNRSRAKPPYFRLMSLILKDFLPGVCKIVNQGRNVNSPFWVLKVHLKALCQRFE